MQSYLRFRFQGFHKHIIFSPHAFLVMEKTLELETLLEINEINKLRLVPHLVVELWALVVVQDGCVSTADEERISRFAVDALRRKKVTGQRNVSTAANKNTRNVRINESSLSE